MSVLTSLRRRQRRLIHRLQSSMTLLLLPFLLPLLCWWSNDCNSCQAVFAFHSQQYFQRPHPVNTISIHPSTRMFSSLQSNIQPLHLSTTNDYDDVERTLLMGRRFQLEEKEDHANCITEILLQADHTVVVGQSDGPLFTTATGSWSYDQELFPSQVAFAMKLDRTYKAGYKGTDMGEFTFVVSRTYVGSLIRVGSIVAIEGSIYKDDHDDDDNDDDDAATEMMGRVGFFSMIDTTPTEDDDDNDENDDDNNNNNNLPPNFMMRTSASF